MSKVILLGTKANPKGQNETICSTELGKERRSRILALNCYADHKK